MRARGAKSTDIAVIVVAADDGVMPQTVEAINHAQAAEVPIVVAVNKIDKEGANPAKIRQQLTEYGLVAEEYGGDTMFVDISAKQGTNIDALLEAILLTADASLDLRANPDMEAQGVAIEAHLDRGRGPVATVLVQRGTLQVGDSIVAGDASGRVRRMLDEHGGDIIEAYRRVRCRSSGSPRCPARATRSSSSTRTGWPGRSPTGGARVSATPSWRAAASGSAWRTWTPRSRRPATLNLIIKGDNSGTVEALEDALVKIEVGDDVELRVIHRGVGGITEGDVNLAIADNVIVLGFNVRAEGKATRAGQPRGRRDPLLLGDLPGHRGDRAGPQGHAQAGVRGGRARPAEVREVFRSPVRHHRGLHRAGRGDPAQRQGPAAPRQRGGRGEPDDQLAAAVQGRRDRGPRGLRVRSDLGNYNDIKVGDVVETFEMREKAG